MQVNIKMLSYWQIGSGKGRGADVDALVLKDADNLPYIPGRAVKGLFREAFQVLEDCKLCEAGLTSKLFGEEGKKRGDTQGILVFGNAVLNGIDRAWLLSDEGKACIPMLYDCFSSTKIGKNGIAVDNTLRTVEATVPMLLTAEIGSLLPIDDYTKEQITKAASLIRALGVHRKRGMGRCECSVTEGSEA